MGIVGLGRMGGNMTIRLLRAGHGVVAHDRSDDAVGRAAAEGATPAGTLEAVVAALGERPRVVWVMVPAGDPTTQTIAALGALLEPGDIVIDGGNTYWRRALEDAECLRPAGVHYLDAGTSGGVWGLENGYSLMVGGDDDPFRHCLPIFRSLAPAGGGLVHTGPAGSGHFVKMVHNGIEYGLMQAYAEGFEVMQSSSAFPGLDLRAIAEAWREGSVVRSWLLDLVAAGLAEDPALRRLSGYVEDTGEGRWTIEAAIAEDVPTPVITAALYARLRSRIENSFADRMLAMVRNQFGGHAVRAAGPPPR